MEQLLLILTFVVLLTVSLSPKVENFDIINTGQPNWFSKSVYNPNDWIVRTYPDRIQPNCLPYSLADRYGSLNNLNYLSQATRFWRF